MLSFSRFLDPLLVLLVALGLALAVTTRRSRLATRRIRVAGIVAWVAWGGLWALSTPFVSDVMTGWVEMRGPDLGTALAGVAPDKAAMVVLAAAMRTGEAGVPPRERLDAASTQRVLTASRLWQDHRFGMVLMSGTPAGESEAMAALATALGVPSDRIVCEGRSLNTRQNAANSAAIAREHGMETVVLVTSATHLRRAVKDFAAAGMAVIPAAADVYGGFELEGDSFLPSSNALARSKVWLHELLGYVRG